MHATCELESETLIIMNLDHETDLNRRIYTSNQMIHEYLDREIYYFSDEIMWHDRWRKSTSQSQIYNYHDEYQNLT